MKTTAIFWACVWGIVFILGIVGIFWNPAQILTVIISGGFCAAFIADYIKARRLEK